MSQEDTRTRAENLLKLLDLERIEEDLYLGQNEQLGMPRLFGGQVLSQAAMAASRTVGAELACHSMHAYFLTAGTPDTPVLYEIERIRNGRSFSTRRVVAVQHGKAIFNMDISFQISEPGFEHAHPAPNVPRPEELKDDVTSAAASGEDARGVTFAGRPRPFELRSVVGIDTPGWLKARAHNPVWIRFPVAVQDDALARSLLAYASDMGLVSTATLPHQGTTSRAQLQMASLDHALWIHRTPDFADWMLINKRTSRASGSRGMVHADIFSRGGTLIASITQEGLIRQVR